MGLFGEEQAVVARRKKAPKKPGGDPAVQRMFTRYRDGFLRRWNACFVHHRMGCTVCELEAWAAAEPGHLVRPIINGGHAGKQFKEYLAAWGEEQLQAVIDYFFATTDPQVTRGDYKLTGSSGAFFVHAQRLLLDLKRNHGQRAVDVRTHENISAAHRATRTRQT